MMYRKSEIKEACERAMISQHDILDIVTLLDKVAEEKRKPKAPPSPLTKPIVDSYHDFFVAQMGVKPKITVQDGTAAKDIAKYLEGAVRAKNPSATDIDIINSWKFLLFHYDRWDKFHQKQLKLSQIGSNINNIIFSIKQSNGKQLTAENSVEHFNAIIEDRIPH